MTTATAEPTQLIPGYTTTERLGSGGYGEVWRAEAPGGFQKAIKVVYGFHDDERAKRELKALEHIKCVRHPFLLTVERAEIIEGRLAILMELADESLDQRFDECREEGLPGIPRDELLGYMHDAADALDFLFKRHALQHLDIKPENLLLVAGHIKVADFGLVKDVTERSQFSMVGGMTPTYAAPEIFDGRPSRHSDQYSLAIVYQEMLTGALPFPGRTSAQLALQHTQGRPMLTSLPVQDREIVARALSKAPTERFDSCLEFIETLRGDRKAQASQPAAGKEEEERKLSEQAKLDETKSIASGATECLSEEGSSAGQEGVRTKRESSQRIVRTEAIDGAEPSSPSRSAAELREQERPLRISSQIIEASFPPTVLKTASFRPTLYIGIGGLGGRVLSGLRKELTRHRDVEWSRVFPLLLMDTDRVELQAIAGGAFGASVAKSETCHLPLRRPQHYRSESAELLQWLSRRWLYNIPRTLQTRGFRPLGRLALVDHAEKVHELLQERLELLFDRAKIEEFAREADMACRSAKPRVVLVASTNGGTGGGMAVDVAYAVRAAYQHVAAQVGGEAGVENLEVMGVLTHSTRRREEENALSVANAYSFLGELATINHSGYRGSRTADQQAARFEGDGVPFGPLYFVHLGDDLNDQECEISIRNLVEYLACDAVTPLGAALEDCRRTAEAPPRVSRDVYLRTFALVRHEPSDDKPSHEGSRCANAIAGDQTELAVLPHGCGHTRRLVAVAPGGEQHAKTVEAIRRAVPGGVLVAANFHEPFVLCEADGLSLAHLAEKLVENRPDAAEAAHRLHTRNDIDWHKIPRVASDEHPRAEPVERPAKAGSVDQVSEPGRTPVPGSVDQVTEVGRTPVPGSVDQVTEVGQPTKAGSVEQVAEVGHPSNAGSVDHLTEQGHPPQAGAVGQVTEVGHPPQAGSVDQVTEVGHSAKAGSVDQVTELGHPARGPVDLRRNAACKTE